MGFAHRLLAFAAGVLVAGGSGVLAGPPPPTPHVWLHYDYLVYADGTNDAPNPVAIQRVVDAFAARGIVLHIDNDHAAVPSPTADVALSGPSTDCLYYLENGTQGYRRVMGLEDVKAQYFHPTANHEWHYALFGGRAHGYCWEAGFFSGKAEINGNNFVVGRDSYRLLQGEPAILAEAGTFMHELGHNLGLKHGGLDDTNYKPNYLSVMNYAFQRGIFSMAAPGGPTLPWFLGQLPVTGIRLDYSGAALPSLDTAHLNENLGIQAGTTDVTSYCLDKFRDTFYWFMNAPASGPIDWNFDGRIDPDVSPLLVDCGNGYPLEGILRGHDDWAAVRAYILGTTQRGPKTIAHEYAAAQPVVTGISPAVGPASGGTRVTITGEHLRKATLVLFGITPAASFTVVNEKTLVAVSPPVQLSSPNGRPSFLAMDVTVVSGDNPSPSVAADKFTYATVPIITGVSPASGPPGTEVTINGFNFTGVTRVQFESLLSESPYEVEDASRFVVVDDRTLVAKTPACCFAGTKHVLVRNAEGYNLDFLDVTDRFTFTLAPSRPAAICSVTPRTAESGATVVIKGTYVLGATAVTFGAADASSYQVLDAEHVAAVVPAGVAWDTVHVSVSSPWGTDQACIGADDRFQFLPAPPTITAVEPNAGPVSGGTQVIIRGKGFTDTAAVYFGMSAIAQAPAFAVIDDSTIVATSPASPLVGTVDVIVWVLQSGGPPVGVYSTTTVADRYTYQ